MEIQQNALSLSNVCIILDQLRKAMHPNIYAKKPPTLP